MNFFIRLTQRIQYSNMYIFVTPCLMIMKIFTSSKLNVFSEYLHTIHSTTHIQLFNSLKWNDWKCTTCMNIKPFFVHQIELFLSSIDICYVYMIQWSYYNSMINSSERKGTIKGNNLTLFYSSTTLMYRII